MSESNRRGVLKSIGAASAGVSLLSAQPVSAASCSKSLSVRVWPSADFSQYGGRNDFPEATDCEYAIDDVLTQLENGGAISSGSVVSSSTTIYDEFGLGLSTDSNDCMFDDTDQADIRDAIYSSSYDEDVHVIVAEITNFANASWGDHNAWKPDDDANNKGTGFAWVGTEGPYPGTDEVKARYKNLANQEMFHVIVNEDYTSAGDHEMGQIDGPDGGTGPVTPNATFYEEDPDNNPCADQGDQAHEGNCSPSATWNESHTLNITSCAINGVKETCNKESGAW